MSVRVEKELNKAFSSHERVQTVLHSILKVETQEDGTQSFLELLNPSPTLDEATGEGGMDGSECGEGGRTLKVVTAKLDKVLWGKDRKLIEDGTLEARLKTFEEEVEMPEEGRGGLFRLLSKPGVKVEALVLFLSNYFDAAPPTAAAGVGDVLGNLA